MNAELEVLYEEFRAKQTEPEAEVFEDLTPAQIRAFFGSAGWQEVSRWVDRAVEIEHNKTSSTGCTPEQWHICQGRIQTLQAVKGLKVLAMNQKLIEENNRLVDEEQEND